VGDFGLAFAKRFTQLGIAFDQRQTEKQEHGKNASIQKVRTTSNAYVPAMMRTV
jgi:hypothetical protein